MPSQNAKSHVFTSIVSGAILVAIGALLFALELHEGALVRSTAGAVALAWGAARFSRLFV
jgi:hypothetical protein